MRTKLTIAAALVAGGLSALPPLLHAQSAAPQTPVATQPPVPPGMLPTTEIPYFADWASSPHARREAEPFNHWNKEGTIPVECARCHSTPGYLDWLGADGSAPGKVDHAASVGTVITCVACHNDKARSLTGVTFPSGLTVHEQGASARCMACHQGVESIRSVNEKLAGIGDDEVAPRLEFINVHYAAAGAMIFGHQARVGYEYPGKSYAGRMQHRAPYTTCLACHATHTVAVKVDDCAGCHKEVTDKASLRKIRVGKTDWDGAGNADEGVAQEIAQLRGKLMAAIQDYAKNVAGKPIAYTPEVYPYFFVDTNGNGGADKDEARFPNRYRAWTPRLMKAAYNYQFVTKDPGSYAHNGPYAAQLLQDSIRDLGAKVKVDLGAVQRP